MIAGSTSDMILGGIKARLRGKRLIVGVASESVNALRTVVAIAVDGHFHPVIGSPRSRKFAVWARWSSAADCTKVWFGPCFDLSDA